MTFIDAISGNPRSAALAGQAATVEAPNNNQFDQDTFLKLLVAQLKYQNPMSPQDGTEFLTQTAQFTQLESLQKIEKLMTAQSAASEVLEASSMVGRKVQVALPQGQAGTPVGSTWMSFGGNLPKDATIGAKVDSTITVLANDGTKVPLRAQLTKLADGPDGQTNWELRTFSSTTQISGPHTISFDRSGTRTSPDPVITAKQLNEIPSARGKWDAAGLTLKLGGADDPGRLRIGDGPSTFAAREHNGSDGASVTGIVTGVRFTIDGPLLKIGGREIPHGNVMEVQVTST